MVRLARKSLWTSGQGAGDVGWAEVHRIAGEIALMSPEPDAAKAEAYLERALAVARKQQAKSWELRAAISVARLWRDQGKPQQAREVLAPVYGLLHRRVRHARSEEAKALLDALSSSPDAPLTSKDAT